MLILPTDGGSVPGWWIGFGYMRVPRPRRARSGSCSRSSSSGRGSARTRLGITIQATGSNEKSAFLSGVSITRINVADLRPLRPVRRAAALYLTTQTGAGSPTIGKDYILLSVAAAVIGGISLFGGRGASRRHADRRLHPDAHRQPRLRPQHLELLAAGRLGRDPARRGAGELARREVARAEARRMSAFLARHRADPARLCRDDRAAARDRALLAGLPLGLATCARSLVLAAFIGIVALGQTFVIIGGGIDLSVPWVLNSAAILMALLCGGQDAPLALGRAAAPCRPAPLVGAGQRRRRRRSSACRRSS